MALHLTECGGRPVTIQLATFPFIQGGCLELVAMAALDGIVYGAEVWMGG